MLQAAWVQTSHAGDGSYPQHDDRALRFGRWGPSEDVLRVSVQQPVLPRQVFVLLRHCACDLRKPRYPGGVFRRVPSTQGDGTSQSMETSLEEIIPQETQGAVGTR